MHVNLESMGDRTRFSGLDDQPHYSAGMEVVKTYTKCHRLMSHRLAELDLSVAQHEVLLAIGREEGLSQADLATRLLVAKSNVTALLKRMEVSDLVERRRDPIDKRAHQVHLTEAGRALLRISEL